MTLYNTSTIEMKIGPISCWEPELYWSIRSKTITDDGLWVVENRVMHRIGLRPGINQAAETMSMSGWGLALVRAAGRHLWLWHGPPRPVQVLSEGSIVWFLPDFWGNCCGGRRRSSSSRNRNWRRRRLGRRRERRQRRRRSD